MSEITYRPYREPDAPHVKAMLNEAFRIHRYTAGPGSILTSALEVYLRKVLAGSTYSQVAVADGRAVGIVTGRVKGEAFLPGRLGNRLRLWAHATKTAITSGRRFSALRQAFGLTRTYAHLRQDVIDQGRTLGDELTVFVVDSSTRGTGVGRELFSRFSDHLHQAGGSDFYLYTDTLCTFGFYEKRGMTRAAERTVPLSIQGLPERLGVYLYTGEASPTRV